MSLNNIGVACTAIGNRIVITRVSKKDPGLSLEQKDAEGMVMSAIVDHLTRIDPDAEEITKSFTLGGVPYELTLHGRQIQCLPHPGESPMSESCENCRYFKRGASPKEKSMCTNGEPQETTPEDWCGDFHDINEENEDE